MISERDVYDLLFRIPKDCLLDIDNWKNMLCEVLEREQLEGLFEYKFTTDHNDNLKSIKVSYTDKATNFTFNKKLEVIKELRNESNSKF